MPSAKKLSNTKTAADCLVSVLIEHGVDRVYSLAGESFLAILESLRDEKRIDLVTCHHEGSAGFMGVADARLTGKLAVCMVSRGPGATNAAIALHTAKDDAVPLCLFVGQVAKKYLRRDGFQEIEYSKMFGDVAKAIVEITDPERLAEQVTRAIHSAYSGTPGPVVVVVPEDMLTEEVRDVVIPPAFRRPESAPDLRTLDEIAKLLSRAERPLLICGGEIAAKGGREALLACAEAWQIPVTVSFRRHDLFPNSHRLFAGDLGLQTSEAQFEAYQKSDLIIAIGTRLGDLSTRGYTFPDCPKPRQTFVHVYDDPAVIGRHFSPDFGLVCAAEKFLSELTKRASKPGAGRETWINGLRKLRTDHTIWKAPAADDGIAFGNVVTSLQKHLKRDAIVVLDAGMAAALSYRYVEWNTPQILLAPITGSMGFGISAAIAASMRYPERQVVLIAGDGGFLMSVAELALATERQLPIRCLVANNRSYGVIRLHQEHEYGASNHVGTDLSTPDFSMLARAFGFQANVIAKDADIDAGLTQLFAASGPALLEVRTSLLAQLPART